MFVSRPGATSRRIPNQAGVSSQLAGYGLATIQLEKLSLSRQIRPRRDATHVIGVDGAAFTHLMHVSIQKLPYHFHRVPSKNSAHGIYLSRQLIDDFLAICPS